MEVHNNSSRCKVKSGLLSYSSGSFIFILGINYEIPIGCFLFAWIFLVSIVNKSLHQTLIFYIGFLLPQSCFSFLPFLLFPLSSFILFSFLYLSSSFLLFLFSSFLIFLLIFPFPFSVSVSFIPSCFVVHDPSNFAIFPTLPSTLDKTALNWNFWSCRSKIFLFKVVIPGVWSRKHKCLKVFERGDFIGWKNLLDLSFV